MGKNNKEKEVEIKNNSKVALEETQTLERPVYKSKLQDQKYVAPNQFLTEEFVMPVPQMIDYGHTQAVSLNPLYNPKDGGEKKISDPKQINIDYDEIHAIKQDVLSEITRTQTQELEASEKTFRIWFWSIFWVELIAFIFVFGAFMYGLALFGIF